MAKANLKKKLQFWGTGRRKKAIAAFVLFLRVLA